jgi:beta-lactam-binding protein with PASTA domain
VSIGFKTRVWGAGKLFLLVGALVLTYVLFAAAAMRIALRARDVAVPALTGKTVNEASAVLSQAGLNLKVEEGRRFDPKIPAGQILTQEPQAGNRLRRERGVKVWVSAGPRSNLVPNLTSESERTAQLRVQQEGLELAGMAEIRSADYPTDAVVAQTPAPNSQGNRVSLLVNRPQRGVTYVMPDLIGVNGDRAAELLRSHGFRVAVVGDTPYPGVPAGIVLRQNPQAGFQIAPGEPISIEVSR